MRSSNIAVSTPDGAALIRPTRLVRPVGRIRHLRRYPATVNV
ncbi:hypothetical protein HMPREF0208_05001 [Citrobacter koseri]|nr:hypothetical protein HMPREF0208_05001 [Citrobacter koseri]